LFARTPFCLITVGGISSKPRGEIYLTDCEVKRDKANKRPHTMLMTHAPTKKQYYVSAGCDETLQEWITVIVAAGAIDKDIVEMENMIKEREKKEEQTRLAREQKKKEDDYVRAKLKRLSTLRLINKNMTDGEMQTCKCKLQVDDELVSMPVSKDDPECQLEFRIDVIFDEQQWTVFRKFEKIAKLYNSVLKLKFVKGMCPPLKCPANMNESDFTCLQVSKLQAMLDVLSKNRSCVFPNAAARQGFLRFIAPVGWNDIKGDRFVMPFMLEL